MPNPKYSAEKFPGHAALIDGDWKLHRIEGQGGKLTWELYNLQLDPAETKDQVDEQGPRLMAMKSQLLEWLTSVTNSLNGDDYQ